MPILAAEDGNWRWLTASAVLLGTAIFLLTAGLSLFVTMWLLLRLPADYFVGPRAPAFWSNRHPLLRAAGRAGKNLIGAVLVAAGVILSLPGVPGQGLLTILIGLIFLDIPGKRRLEQRFVRHPRVLGVINRLRIRHRRAPLRVDDEPFGARGD